MTPWAHHLASRWTAAFRTPMACFVAIGAAFFVTGIPAKTLSDPDYAASKWPSVELAAMFLLTASSFVAASGAGRSSSGRFPGFLPGRGQPRDWPNPALPLGPGVRALVEALAGFGAMVIWQVVLIEADPFSVFPGPKNFGLSLPAWLSVFAATWCVIVPAAMVWLLPARSRVVSLLRGLIVTILATVALAMPFNSVPVVLVFAAALVAALLATARIAMIPGPFTLAARSSGPAVMFREPRAPLAQLWRDACLWPVREGKPMFIIAAACFVPAAALSRAHVAPDMLVYLLTMVSLMSVAITLAMYPLGTHAIAAGQGVAASLFNGNIGRAWIGLPLRREWVTRSFYVHGLIAGLTFVALNYLGMRITGGPAFFSIEVTSGAIDWVALLCAVPPFAGFLTCRAAGDRVRGAISLVSLVLILAGLPFMLTANRHALLALTVVLAVAGGAPPIVHLFAGHSRYASWGA